MDKYTPNDATDKDPRELDALADFHDSKLNFRTASILRAYAATLRQQAERGDGAVSDEVVVHAVRRFNAAYASDRRPRLVGKTWAAMRAALEAVAPLLRAPAEQGGRVDEGSLASRIGKDLQNPLFWLDALRTNIHTTDCAEKQRVLGNVEHALRKFCEAALAQNTQGDGEPVAESCSDHVKGETGYCTFLAPVPFGTKLYLHAERARVPDSDRIDWMEANARSVSFGKAPQQGYWVHVQGADSVYSHNESLRGAIDSARGAQAAQLAAAPSKPKDAGEVES